MVLWRHFVRICPVFRIFGGYGQLEGLDGVSPSAGASFVGWVGWVAGVGGWLAWFFVVLLFQIQKHFKEVRGASRSDYVIPASRPSRKLQAVPGEGFSRAVTSRSCSARRWYSTALVALRGGCPLSRAVRRPAFAVTLSSVIRGGDEPLSELSVLARKRSGDRGDLSFPVVESVPIVVEGLGRRCKQASYYAALDPVALAGLRMASSIHRSL